MKRHTAHVVFGLFLAVALVALAAPANAEMYVEGYLGGASGVNSNATGKISSTNNVAGTTFTDVGTFTTSGIAPNVFGGAKLGTWFVKEGFLGMNYPDWMKYLGFYLDLGVQKLNYPQTLGHWTGIYQPGSYYCAGVSTFTGEGFATTLAFMFAGRYGFLKDDQVPFGRLQPYIAVGPGIIWTSLSPNVAYNNFTYLNGPINIPFTSGPMKMESQTSANICLAVDAGIRYMMLKNVSIDISFKYRYAQPSYTFHGAANVANNSFWNGTGVMGISPTLNLFSGQVGVAYHF